MIFFYSMAMLPILIGLYFWWKVREVTWWEWVCSCAISLLMAVVFHAIALESQCRDHEVFSGQIVSATHHPYWQSREEVDDYEDEEYTDSDGNTHTRRVKTGSHYEYEDHRENWTCEAYFGTYTSSETYDIERSSFEQISTKFCDGKLRATQPWKPNFYKGDKNEYVADNKNKYCFPTTKWVAFENRIKASPSLYSYAPVPKDAKVFPYPGCKDPFVSDRLVGTARQTISARDWDVMCSAVGPSKKVNLILVGFGDVSSEMGHFQEAAWIGGKKNDLVLCYGGKDIRHPSWTYVFGWTDKSLVKINLQSILLKNPVDATILPKIIDEVKANYQIKEWKDFNYLQVEPPTWCYVVYIVVMILSQVGFWIWARSNEFDKDGENYDNGYRGDKYGYEELSDRLMTELNRYFWRPKW